MRVTGFIARPLWQRTVYTLSYGGVLALAIIGMFRPRKRPRREAILWAVGATFVATHAVFFPATRYRLPMDFVLIYYAAVELDFRTRQWFAGRQTEQIAIAESYSR